MADKHSIYNLTLVHLGERELAALGNGNLENRDPKRTIDALWDHTVQLCLEEAQWNWMIRAVQADASASVTSAFGWNYAFTIPDDWLRTTLVSGSETFNPPLLDFTEESGYWYSNVTPLYIKYQSSDIAYGGNIGEWTASFVQYLSLQIAELACYRIAGKMDLLAGLHGITNRLKKARIKAKSNDAMNQGPQEMPTGTWARSRRGFVRGGPLPGGTSFDD